MRQSRVLPSELRKSFGMKNTGKDFETVDNAWARTCEVGAGVHQISFPSRAPGSEVKSGRFFNSRTHAAPDRDHTRKAPAR